MHLKYGADFFKQLLLIEYFFCSVALRTKNRIQNK